MPILIRSSAMYICMYVYACTITGVILINNCCKEMLHINMQPVELFRAAIVVLNSDANGYNGISIDINFSFFSLNQT